MPLYSNVILAKKPTSNGTQTRSNEEASSTSTQNKKPSHNTSMKFLQDHLLSKRRSNQQATPICGKIKQTSNKSAEITNQVQSNNPVAHNSKLSLENSLWDSDEEYDPLVPNSYELLQTEFLKAEEARLAVCRSKRLDSIPNLMDIINHIDSLDEVDGTVNIPKGNAIAPPPSLVAGTCIPPPITGPTPSVHCENPAPSSSVITHSSIPPPQATSTSTQVISIANAQIKSPPDGATKVVLLQNMVGPGEVDEDLEVETKEECEKYGAVSKCLIYEIPNKRVPDSEAVRIFVEFCHIESARKAVNDLNGRYFGGRVVKASFYSVDRFNKYDLGCSTSNTGNESR